MMDGWMMVVWMMDECVDGWVDDEYVNEGCVVDGCVDGCVDDRRMCE